MRKWIRDAERHGHPIGLYKAKPGRYGMDWGGGNPYTGLIADDFTPLVIDGRAQVQLQADRVPLR
jgi:hypothetical protein